MSSDGGLLAPSGLDDRQVVQIVTVSEDGGGRRGSGYQVASGRVLTAAHVLDGARHVRVRFLDDGGAPGDIDADTEFLHFGLDVAVLKLRPVSGAGGDDVPPRVQGTTRYGRLSGAVPCEAMGFPLFKLRREGGTRAGGMEYRDTRQAYGHAAGLSGRREGTLEITVEPPGDIPDSGRHSPWEGMSGAAVWSGGCLIGVVSEHRATDGAGTLTASRIDRWHQKLSREERDTLHTLIGLPRHPGRLTDTDPRAQRIHAYLSAALASTREHPYVGSILGEAPPLADIHVGQRARPRGSGAAAIVAAELSADELMHRLLHRAKGVTLLTAGPGGGKSTLLRMVLASLAARRLAGEDVHVLPVLLRASDLVRKESLPQAICRAVTRDLSRFGLLEEPSPDVFRTEPERGVPWLVMVDALDEILLPEHRREALQTIAAFGCRAEHGTSPFRFLVTTRPLPEDQVSILGADTQAFELLPFDAMELHQLAANWFRASSRVSTEPMPRGRAPFPGATDGMGTVPLMGALLCALRQAAPDGPLPADRGDLFRRFVGALADRHHAAGLAGIKEQTRQALGRYGDEVLHRAQLTVDSFFVMVAEVASRQIAMSAGLIAPAAPVRRDFSVLDAVRGRPEAARPDPVPEETWLQFLGDLLRHSGLFTEDESGFRFLHQTLADYLAAEAATRSARQWKKELRAFLGPGLLPELPGGRRARTARRTAHMSYIGFLLDAEAADGSGSRTLHRLARDGELSDLELIAAQARLGTRLRRETVTTATEALASRAGGPNLLQDSSLRAALALADLNDARAQSILLGIARDTNAGGLSPLPVIRSNEAAGNLMRLFNGLARVQAAFRVAEGGDERGTKILLELVHGDGLHPLARVFAAGGLSQLGHDNAQELLLSLARDSRFEGSGRALAARLLGVRFDDPRARAILVAMTRDRGLDPVSRVNAAHSLSRLGDSRARTVLRELANPASCSDCSRLIKSFVHVKAARVLAEHDDKRAPELLRSLAQNAQVHRYYRRRAKIIRSMIHKGIPLRVRSEEDRLRLETDIREMAYGRQIRLLTLYFRIQNRVLLPFVLRRSARRTDHEPL
ncbi:trypsin-like peptidase domain-containing protein [Streptomyces sp. NPDC052301]|uniref:trypsin-like peptidase domain-containing protein n=1 Tax=Streptomyces sp. NPDC052301 TaxID=3365687 RepID=UPI0037CDB19A